MTDVANDTSETQAQVAFRIIPFSCDREQEREKEKFNRENRVTGGSNVGGGGGGGEGERRVQER